MSTQTDNWYTKLFQGIQNTVQGIANLQPATQQVTQGTQQPATQEPVQATPTPAPQTSGGTGSYTVVPGDTLSEIAQRLGLPHHSSLTGYRSGNPDLIYPGEQLSYTMGGTTPTAQPMQPAQTPQGPTAESITGQFPSITDSLRQEWETVQQNREEARINLENARTERFNAEYEKAQMPELKERISMVDQDIADLRRQKEESILAARRNPNVSAGVLTGEIQKLDDYFNGMINGYINERNAIADQYNKGLDEIDTRVMHSLGDLITQYDHWGQLESEVTRNMARYEDILRQELSDKSMQDRWQQEFDLGSSQFERELAQRLQIAGMNQGTEDGSVKLTAVERKNELGRSTGEIDWYNPYTGELVKTTQK
jgi:hypothetical protein